MEKTTRAANLLDRPRARAASILALGSPLLVSISVVVGCVAPATLDDEGYESHASEVAANEKRTQAGQTFAVHAPAYTCPAPLRVMGHNPTTGDAFAACAVMSVLRCPEGQIGTRNADGQSFTCGESRMPTSASCPAGYSVTADPRAGTVSCTRVVQTDLRCPAGTYINAISDGPNGVVCRDMRQYVRCRQSGSGTISYEQNQVSGCGGHFIVKNVGDVPQEYVVEQPSYTCPLPLRVMGHNPTTGDAFAACAVMSVLRCPEGQVGTRNADGQSFTCSEVLSPTSLSCPAGYAPMAGPGPSTGTCARIVNRNLRCPAGQYINAISDGENSVVCRDMRQYVQCAEPGTGEISYDSNTVTGCHARFRIKNIGAVPQ